MDALAVVREDQHQNAPPRVLVVDDEPAQRRVLAQALDAEGYEVVEASTGEAALKVLYTSAVAVALVDQNLPGGVKGLEILHACHRDFPLTRLIMITGTSNVTLAVAALRNGAFDFLEKPVQPVLLREKVKRAVESHHMQLGKENLLQRYETLFETIPGVVFFVADDGVLRRVNREGAHLLGYEPAQLLGQHYSLLMEKDAAETADQFVFRERRTGARVRQHRTVTLVTRHGEKRTFDFLATGVWAVRGGGGQTDYVGNIGAGWDITQRLAMEAQLRQRHKMEAIGRLAGGIAHDFNNIMSVINANVRMIAHELPATHPLQDLLKDVDMAGHQAADLTRQLLTFSRKRPPHLQALELHAIIAGMTPLLRRLMGETVRLETRLCPQRVPMQADHSQLEQLIMNLCINARDAMPAGGVVTITTLPLLPAPVETGPFIRLSVTDCGAGMEESVQQRLFEPFFTTKDAAHGTGLGLAVVHGVVQQHGGTIRVESALGVGTTMHVELPYDPHLAVAAPAPTVTTAGKGGAQTILVVEDEDMVRRMLRRLLEREGYRVLEAGHGGQAMHLLNQNAGAQRPALIITDMVMPVMGGAELARQVRDQVPAIPMIAVSGYSKPQDVDQLAAMGIPFVEKPIAPGKLLEAIQKLLQRSADPAHAPSSTP